MDITTMIQEFIMPIALVGCFALGAALKSMELFPDKYIPLAMLICGACIAPLVTGDWSAQTIMIGAISGWASTGLHQTFKQLNKKDGNLKE